MQTNPKHRRCCECSYLSLGFVVVAFLVFSIPVAVAHPYPSSLAPTWLSKSAASPLFAHHTHTYAPRNHPIIPTLPSFASLHFCVKCTSSQSHRTTTTFGQTRQAQSVYDGTITAYVWLYALAPLAHLNFVAMYVFLGAVMTLSILNVRSHIKRYGVAVLPWVNMGARGDLQTGLSFSTTF